MKIQQEYVDTGGQWENLVTQTVGVDLERVSHVIKELKQSGTDIVGKAKIIDTLQQDRQELAR